MAEEADSSDGFLLLTSGEFCDGTARSRATQRDQADEVVSGSEAELATLADWEAWEREEEAEHHQASQPYWRVPTTEVLRLLLQVPPGLRGRYTARLRAEAQQRRCRSVQTGCTSWSSWSQVWPKGRSLMAVAVALLTWRQASGAAEAAMATVAALEVPLWIRHATAADVPMPEPMQMPSTSEACARAMARAEDEAISLEVLYRRDILGYNQMLLAVHDWTGNLKRAPPVLGIARVTDCLTAESTRYLELVKKLRAALLASHARAARARGRLTVERQTRLSVP